MAERKDDDKSPLRNINFNPKLLFALENEYVYNMFDQWK